MTRAPWFVTFVGTGSMSSSTRNLPAIVVRMPTSTLLFDCGDGTMARLRQSGIGLGLDAVLLTSLGSAEISGLLAVGEIAIRDQTQRLRLVGPPGTERLADTLSSFSELPGDLFDVTEAEGGDVVVTTAGGSYVEAIEMERATAENGLAYLIYEDQIPGRVDAVKAKALGISGTDFAKLQQGETVRRVRPRDVIAPPEPGKRLVICGRGRPTPSLTAELHGANAAGLLHVPVTVGVWG